MVWGFPPEVGRESVMMRGKTNIRRRRNSLSPDGVDCQMRDYLAWERGTNPTLVTMASPPPLRQKSMKAFVVPAGSPLV